MKVIRAHSAGFCFGVSLALRALDKAIEALPSAHANTSPRLITLGPIIHNPLVMDEYAAKGVCCMHDLDGIRGGDHVVIRAHGIPHDKEVALHKLGGIIVDATCPKVKKAQLAIAAATQAGQPLLLFGEKDHPEVQGLVSYAAGQTTVFSSLDDLYAFPLNNTEQYVLAAQTTQDQVAFEAAQAYLDKTVATEPLILNTICHATKRRQEEVINLAGQVEAMVVVGGLNSGNTRRLAEVARDHGVPAWHVEGVSSLDAAALRGFSTIGLTAGASTPDAHILSMQQFLERLR